MIYPSTNLPLTLYFSKCSTFVNILRIFNYCLKHLQTSSRNYNGIGFCEAFYYEVTSLVLMRQHQGIQEHQTTGHYNRRYFF
jgi:hypothetical protein